MLRLYTTKEAYLVVRCLPGRGDDDSALLLCRRTRRLQAVLLNDARARLGITPATVAEAVCAVLGRVEVEGECYAFVVTQATAVATLHRHDQKECPVMRIDKVRALQLSTADSSTPPPSTSSSTASQSTSNAHPSEAPSKGNSSGHNPLANQGVVVATNHHGHNPLMAARNTAMNKLRSGKHALQKFVADRINSTPSMVEEILRLFNEVPDFYYCVDRDFTHTTQRHFSTPNAPPDDRFFWNRHLLCDLYEEGIEGALAKPWRLPIVQGYAASHELVVGEEGHIEEGAPKLRVTLISRRCTRRAGARYLRRGIDEDSNVANFVETELALNVYDHQLSFVQVRGSVPVFWSQQGFRYRPPLTIDRPLDDSQPFFEKHMATLEVDYDGIVVGVSLVDQAGRELKLASSYIEHALRADQPWLHLFSFDFHSHCRGLKFDKVSELVSSLDPLLQTMGFCWVDRRGDIVRRQTGVVRTNCVDCLDRTNVVQGAISQWMCMGQAQRLGLFGPLSEPPEPLVAALQSMWADNGDAISRQYAGTAALKGDVTRSGERKLTGIMKDGVSSATRYYLSHMRDATRQRAINALLNEPDQAPELRGRKEEEGEDEEEEDLNENIGRLVAETTHFLLPENEVLVGGWPLVDAANSSDQVDTVLLLTRQNMYVAVYDEDSEKLEDVHIVQLEEIEALEIGRASKNGRAILRIATKQGAFCVRPSSTRLFNNVVIGLRSGEEADEYAESIGEQLRVTLEMMRGGSWNIGRPAKLTLPSRKTNSRLLNMVSGVFSRSPKGAAAGAGNSEMPMRDRSHSITPTPVPASPSAQFYTNAAAEMSEQVEVPRMAEAMLVDVGSIDGETGKLEVGREAEEGGGSMSHREELRLPPAIRTSQSEGGLSGLVRGLKGLRGGTSASPSMAFSQDPFAAMKERAKTSRTTVHFM